MKIGGTDQKLSWFKKEQEGESLNLAPSFQRRPVWSDEQASYLIDTVLKELPIPEVYLRSQSTPEGETAYEVVDGQQRIRALLRFGAGDLELVGDDVSPDLRGATFENLSKEQKTRFWGYTLVVRDLAEASDTDVRDLFRRLNKNAVVLNDQELRNANFRGSFIKLMEALADDDWWLEHKVVTVRQIRRMEDVEFVSELFIGMMAGPQNKKATLDEYYTTLETSFPDEAKWRSRFEATRALMATVLPSADIVAWSGKSDFYTLFLAFSKIVEERDQVVTKGNVVVNCLSDFRAKVDAAKRKGASPPASGPVGEYVEAVSRAASDIDRRATRQKVVEALLTAALGLERQSAPKSAEKRPKKLKKK